MKRIAQLDGLRFIAVLAVMIGHWLQWQWSNPILLGIPFSHGVTLFFVLSGFLITGILIKSKEKINRDSKKLWSVVRQFYIRRFLRIFPIYYLLIIILLVLNFENVKELLPYLLTYTSNIYISLTNNTIGHFTHLWSLAVEEQFYLLWPFIVLFTNRKFLLKILVILIASSVSFKLISFYILNNWHAVGYSTLGCMHALIIGALLAYLKNYHSPFINKISHPLIANFALVIYALSILFFSLIDVEMYRIIFEEVVFALLAALIILRASNGEFKGPIKCLLENKFIQFTGRISYGMYLYHAFIPVLFYYLNDNYFGLSFTNKYLHFTVNYSITFLASIISWYVIEMPLNNLKSRFPYLVKNESNYSNL